MLVVYLSYNAAVNRIHSDFVSCVRILCRVLLCWQIVAMRNELEFGI